MNRSRFIGIIAIISAIILGAFGLAQATAATTGGTATATVASECVDGKRLVTVAGDLDVNHESGSYDTAIAYKYDDGRFDLLSPVEEVPGGTTSFSLEASFAPGEHELYVFANYADADRFFVTVNPFPVVVAACTSTPVTPTLSASSNSECSLTVLYTGVQPTLTLSVTGKKTLTVLNSDDSEAGRVEYTIDASGGSTKGKNANVYSVLVKADNGLKAKTNVFCR